MTHKTLLAKINKQLKELEPHPEVAPEWLALRAVVKLHQSELVDDFTLPSPITVCKQCAAYYPCATIQTIEKELC